MPKFSVFDPGEPVETTRRSRRGRNVLFSIVGIAALSVAMLGTPGGGFLQTSPAVAQTLPGGANGFADVAEKVRPAVVSIYIKSEHSKRLRIPRDNPFHDFFDRYRRHSPHKTPRLERAQGSGFLVSEDGYVVTNNHVVDDAKEISVRFDNDEKYKAKLIGTDERTDIAVLKIVGKHKFPFLEFAPKSPRVGEWVLAVGNPFGFGGTVTAGIVSADSRSISKGPYDYIQIDAAVNRGNSGGPAVNMKGQVIGVNTAIYSPSGGNVGIAFAVPATLVKTVFTQLKTNGKVRRGWLGVTIQDVSKEIAESLGMKSPKGSLITKIVRNGPSAKSALKMRDVVIEVNGQKIQNSRDLARKIAELAPNSKAELLVIRNGKEKSISVKLGEFPSGKRLAKLQKRGKTYEDQLDELGLTLAPARELKGAGDEGVAITDVNPDSEAAHKGLKTGDIILDVGGNPVSTPKDVLKGVKEAKKVGRKAVLMKILSNRQERYIALSLKKK
jgi:serine protease Do